MQAAEARAAEDAEGAAAAYQNAAQAAQEAGEVEVRVRASYARRWICVDWCAGERVGGDTHPEWACRGCGAGQSQWGRATCSISPGRALHIGS